MSLPAVPRFTLSLPTYPLPACLYTPRARRVCPSFPLSDPVYSRDMMRQQYFCLSLFPPLLSLSHPPARSLAPSFSLVHSRIVTARSPIRASSSRFTALSGLLSFSLSTDATSFSFFGRSLTLPLSSPRYYMFS